MTEDSTTTDSVIVEPPALGTSLIRTLVPMLVMLVVNGLARAGLKVDDGTQQALASLIGLLVGSGYYVIVRELERRAPGLGWLLGSPHAPTYPTKTTPEPPVVVDPGLTLPGMGGTDPVEGP